MEFSARDISGQFLYMTPDEVVDLGRNALSVAVLMAAPMLLSALLTGLLIGLFQAATQIQEQTLSFIPKLLVMVVALVVTGPWLLNTILGYTTELITITVPRIIGT